MDRSLCFSDAARDDLLRLHLWIEGEGGNNRADAYLARIETVCRRLRDFPFIGRPDDTLGPGMRVLGFERRAAIVYRVTTAMVEILAIHHGGRDLQAMHAPPEK